MKEKLLKLVFLFLNIILIKFVIMESIIVHPENKKQLVAVKAVLNVLGINFEKEKEATTNPELSKLIAKGKEDEKLGKTIKIKPADIWNLV